MEPGRGFFSPMRVRVGHPILIHKGFDEQRSPGVTTVGVPPFPAGVAEELRWRQALAGWAAMLSFFAWPRSGGFGMRLLLDGVGSRDPFGLEEARARTLLGDASRRGHFPRLLELSHVYLAVLPLPVPPPPPAPPPEPVLVSSPPTPPFSSKVMVHLSV